MNRPTGRAVITAALLRYSVSLTAAAALLAGCSGSQPPLSASPRGFASQQSHAEAVYQVVHPFGRTFGDGTNPVAGLINVKGKLYGTTVAGGSGSGTVFAVTRSDKETVLYRFGTSTSNDAYDVVAGLVNVDGTLYGTSIYGGKTNGAGTVFKVTMNGDEKVIHNFDYNGRGGSNPQAGLINVDGTLYGTTSGNDDYYGYGNVFRIGTGGKYKVLHRFDNVDGANPIAALLDVDGTLYGTTASGGQYGGGTVFSVTMTGEEEVLHSFGASGSNDGTNPSAALIDVQGTLYGTTAGGGTAGDGTVFSITTGGTENVVHSFSGSDGSQPIAALTNVKGVLYGTTVVGGENNLGTIFRLTKSGTETVVRSFARGDGVNPRAAVIAVGGSLYGTTFGNGPHSKGNVYSLTP